jgi:hypothetical protein
VGQTLTPQAVMVVTDADDVTGFQQPRRHMLFCHDPTRTKLADTRRAPGRRPDITREFTDIRVKVGQSSGPPCAAGQRALAGQDGEFTEGALEEFLGAPAGPAGALLAVTPWKPSPARTERLGTLNRGNG